MQSQCAVIYTMTTIKIPRTSPRTLTHTLYVFVLILLKEGTLTVESSNRHLLSAPQLRSPS